MSNRVGESPPTRNNGASGGYKHTPMYKSPQTSRSSSVSCTQCLFSCQLFPHLTNIMHSRPAEEFGVTNNQATVYSAWLDAIMSSGLTGFNIWQAGSQLSTGNSPNDGYAVYPNSAVYTLLENAVTQLKARG